MNLRYLKVYGSTKYKNKLFRPEIKYNVRSGDRVVVVRGRYAKQLGIVRRILGTYVQLDSIFTKSLSSSKYLKLNGNKRIEVNKYPKIYINNVAHVDENGLLIKIFRKDIVKSNGTISKKNIVDSNGKIIDNFVHNVSEKRRFKKLEKESEKSGKEDKSIEQNTESNVGGDNVVMEDVSDSVEDNIDKGSNEG